MANNIKLTNDFLLLLQKGLIIQKDNFNSNSDLYIYGDKAFKIYDMKSHITKYNIEVLKDIFKHYRELSQYKELVLPEEYLTIGMRKVGYSMKYIKGITLEEAINNNILDKNEVKSIFYKLLDLINKLKKLSFDFYIGDIHEKNVIIDKELNIHIIDSDSFIINNKKNYVDKYLSIGKYINKYFSLEEMSNITSTCDYSTLLYMIIHYIFKGTTEYDQILVDYVKSYFQDKHVVDLINKSKNNNFRLTYADIDYLFSINEFKFRKDYAGIDEEINREIRRLRKR